MKKPAFIVRLWNGCLGLTPFSILCALAVLLLVATGIVFVHENLNPYETRGFMRFRDAVTQKPIWESLPIPLQKPWDRRERVADFCRTYLEGSSSLRRYFPGPARFSDVRVVGDQWVILLKTSGETPLNPDAAAILASDLTASLGRGPLSGRTIRVTLNGEFIPSI